jgi:hypothetical protein
MSEILTISFASWYVFVTLILLKYEHHHILSMISAIFFSGHFEELAIFDGLLCIVLLEGRFSNDAFQIFYTSESPINVDKSLSNGWKIIISHHGAHPRGNVSVIP